MRYSSKISNLNFLFLRLYFAKPLYSEPIVNQLTQSTLNNNGSNNDSNQNMSNDNVSNKDSISSSFVTPDLTTQMQHASLQASQLLKSLSHPDRLLLLCQLTQGEYCVGELECLVGLGQPSLSQQLGILRKDKLVATRREGKQIYYRIASDDALAVLQLLYERFCAKTGA